MKLYLSQFVGCGKYQSEVIDPIFQQETSYKPCDVKIVSLKLNVLFSTNVNIFTNSNFHSATGHAFQNMSLFSQLVVEVVLKMEKFPYGGTTFSFDIKYNCI